MTVSTDNTTGANIEQEKKEQISQSETADNSQAQKSTESKVTEEDPNWRAFREARKKDRAEKEAAERRAAEKEAEAAALKAAMEAAFARESKSVHHRADTENREYAFEEESEDERIEKKVQAVLAARERAAEEARARREYEEYPQRLNQTYSDFTQTVSSENLDYLEYHYPEVANPLKKLPDGFDKWADIYKAVKKFVPNSLTAKKEAARADSNFNKPKSMSSAHLTQPGETAGGNRLTEERKAENWARMKKLLGTVG